MESTILIITSQLRGAAEAMEKIMIHESFCGTDPMGNIIVTWLLGTKSVDQGKRGLGYWQYLSKEYGSFNEMVVEILQ